MRKPRSKTPKLVFVHWKDAAGTRHDDGLEPIDCLSTGWVIELNDEYVKLASELVAGGEYQEVTVIPRGMIQSMNAKPFKLPEEFVGWEAS